MVEKGTLNHISSGGGEGSAASFPQAAPPQRAEPGPLGDHFVAVAEAQDPIVTALPSGFRHLFTVPGRLSPDAQDLARFKTVINRIEKGSLDPVQAEDTLSRWHRLWEELPSLEADVSAWAPILKNPRGKRLVLALFNFTERLLDERPGWKGLLADCAEKMALIVALLHPAKDQALVARANDLKEKIRQQGDFRDAAWLSGEGSFVDTAMLAHPQHGLAYQAQAAQALFSYSLGNPKLERRLVAEFVRLTAQLADEGVRAALRNILHGLAGFTDKMVFNADNALTVRDHSGVLGLDRPFPILTSSDLFPSDQWSQISARGFLAQARRMNDWEGADVLEIGTGTGILPLFMAEQTRARSIDSVDINPQAKPVATLNRFLREGAGVPKALLDRVGFFDTADLDEGAPAGKLYDIVFGCISQAPSTQARISDRERADVYPASDYPEDIDGFGLLAKALKRGLDRLKPGGAYLLTVSGRPALEAVVKMANLRGWVATLVLEDMILQHKGTDLTRYVEIEKSGVRLPFEFWVENKKINATEAKRRIDEYLSKYAAATPHRRRVLDADPYYQVSHKIYVIKFKPLRDYEAQIKEQALEQLRAHVNGSKGLFYFNETGTEYASLGQHLSRYLTTITSVSIPREMLFIAPNLERLVYNFARATVEGEEPIYLDPAIPFSNALWNNMGRQWDRAERTKEAALAVVRLEGRTKEEIEDLLTESKQLKRPIFLVADQAGVNELNYALGLIVRDKDLAARVAISWQNNHLPLDGPPLATLILPNQKVYETLANIGKDTYSRVSLRAVHEAALLGAVQGLSGIHGDFSRLPRSLLKTAKDVLPPAHGKATDVSVAAHRLASFPSHPPRLEEKGRIDLSFGESEALMSDESLQPLLAQLDLPVPAQEEVKARILRHLVSRHPALSPSESSSIVFGAGVHPLIQQTLQNIGFRHPGASVLMPRGYYGQFPSTIHLAGLGLNVFDPSYGDPDGLISSLERAWQESKDQRKPLRAILLNYPSNPSGLYYSPGALRQIARFAKAHDLLILADEVFFETGSPESRASFLDLMDDPEMGEFLRKHLVTYGGVSKDMGWGMARFGYAYSADERLLKDLGESLLDPPDPMALRLAHLAYDPEYRSRHLEKHLNWLGQSRAKLMQALAPAAARGHVSYHEPQGGYFVELDVHKLFGQTLRQDNRELARIDAQGTNLRQILHDHFGLIVSPVGWSGHPGAIRLVYSIRDLDEAIVRLGRFLESVPEVLTEVRPKRQMHVEASLQFLTDRISFVNDWPQKPEKGVLYVRNSGSVVVPAGQPLFLWWPANIEDPLPLRIVSSDGDGTLKYVVANLDTHHLTALVDFLLPPMHSGVNQAFIPVKLTSFLSDRDDMSVRGTEKRPQPPFAGFDEAAFSRSLQSVDGRLQVKSVHYVSALGQVVVALQADGQSAGKLSFYHSLRPDGAVAIQLDYIDIEERAQGYGMEMVGNIMRYFHSLPQVQDINYRAEHQSRFVWKNIDGFRLEKASLTFARKTLKRWALHFGWNIRDEDIKSAASPLALARLIDLGSVFPPLVAESIRVSEDSGRPLGEAVMRSRFPGEVALLGHQVSRRRPAYDMHLNLRDEADYASFLDSLLKYWDSKAHLIPRAAGIIESIRAERADLRAPVRHFLTLHPFEVKASARAQGVVASEWPEFLDAAQLRAFVKSADGYVGIGQMLSRYNELSDIYDVTMDFVDAQGRHLGALTLAYAKDPRHEGQWTVRDSYVRITGAPKNQKYGIELRTKVIRYHYAMPSISGWEFPLTEEGLLVLRHLNGVKIKGSFLETARQALKRLNETYRLKLNEAAIDRSKSVWDMVNSFKLPRERQELSPLVRQALPDYLVSTAQELSEKTKNVGELAVWVAQKAMRAQKPLSAYLDLTFRNADYAEFLKSLEKYWMDRVQVDRGLAILNEIRQELRGLGTHDQNPGTRALRASSTRPVSPPTHTSSPSGQVALHSVPAQQVPQQSTPGGSQGPINQMKPSGVQGLLQGAGGVHPSYGPMVDGSNALALSAYTLVETPPLALDAIPHLGTQAANQDVETHQPERLSKPKKVSRIRRVIRDGSQGSGSQHGFSSVWTPFKGMQTLPGGPLNTTHLTLVPK